MLYQFFDRASGGVESMIPAACQVVEGANSHVKMGSRV